MPTDVSIRLAAEQDSAELRRLVAIDGGRALEAPVLIACEDGSALAAISLADGRHAADPFRRTGPLVEMLRIRAAHLGRQAEEQGAGRRSSQRGWRMIGRLEALASSRRRTGVV